MSKNARILLIPDLHCPYQHPDAVRFLKAIKKKYKPDRIICLGDEVDFHALSYHESDPDLTSAGPELSESVRALKPLYSLFPKVDILESNHGSLVYRKAKTAGLPRQVLRGYREILQAPPGWRWHFDLRIVLPGNKTLYIHHGKSPKAGHLSMAESSCSAQGHYHTKFHITYWRNSQGLYWDIHCGYLASHDSLAFAYDKSNIPKGIVGAAIILNGQPKLLPMILDRRGRWTGELG